MTTNRPQEFQLQMIREDAKTDHALPRAGTMIPKETIYIVFECIGSL